MLSLKAVEKSMRKTCTSDQLRNGVSDELAGAVKSKKKSGKEKKKQKKKTKVVAKPVETKCQRSHGEPTSVGPLSSCFKSGEGHFAPECTSSTKVHKRNLDIATPTLKLCKGNRETARGFRSMPSDSGKTQKRKMTQFGRGRFSTPPKAKRSVGWITDYTGDLQCEYAQVPGWRSPVIPTYNRNLMYTQVAHGHISSSYSLTRAQELHFGPSASNVSPIFYQNMHSPSIYGNFSGYGMRSNYYW